MPATLDARVLADGLGRVARHRIVLPDLAAVQPALQNAVVPAHLREPFHARALASLERVVPAKIRFLAAGVGAGERPDVRADGIDHATGASDAQQHNEYGSHVPLSCRGRVGHSTKS